jgi:hypothetical protein
VTVRSAAYCTSQDVLTRLAGTPIDMSGTMRGSLVAKIPEVCSDIDRRVRLARGQRPGWSFLAASEHEVQLVSFAGSATAGSFILALGLVVTGPIAWNADSAAVQVALDAALGEDLVTVSPAGAGGPFTLAFSAVGPQELFVAIPSLTPATSYLVVERLVPGAVLPIVRRYTAKRGSGYLPIDDAVSVSRVRFIARGGGAGLELAVETDYLPSPLNALPIQGLELVRGGGWPSNVGGVEVTLVPGYATEVLTDVREAAIIEVIRSYYGDRTGNDDRIGMTPFGQISIAKAFTSKLGQLVDDYRRGDAFLRTIG